MFTPSEAKGSCDVFYCQHNSQTMKKQKVNWKRYISRLNPSINIGCKRQLLINPEEIHVVLVNCLALFYIYRSKSFHVVNLTVYFSVKGAHLQATWLTLTCCHRPSKYF